MVAATIPNQITCASEADSTPCTWRIRGVARSTRNDGGVGGARLHLATSGHVFE
jgi:hypothetical protein